MNPVLQTASVLRPQWPAPAAVQAACTMRQGGVSVGPFSSLNMGAQIGDDPAAVSSNRRRVRHYLRLNQEPVWLNQVHGCAVLDADDTARAAAAPLPQADAAVTRIPGRVLAVRVADCMPVLLARTDGAAVAVAHAGWRGLAQGVLEASVAALGAQSADVLAWLGPAIGPAHFEVGEEVRAAFYAHDRRAADAFSANARGRWQCDLYQLARQRLQGVGVTCIHGERRCTYAEKENFYSYRRDGVTGRMAAFIWIEAT